MGARQIRDLAELRVFAHPLRLRLFYALATEQEATASRLAALVDESVSLVSYHLRELAAHGSIETARAGPATAASTRGGPAARASVRPRHSLPNPVARPVGCREAAHAGPSAQPTERFIDEEPAWGRDWSDAAFSSDMLLQLTATSSSQLPGRTSQCGDPLARASTGRRGAAARRGCTFHGVGHPPRHVMLIMHGFPFTP